MNICNEYPCSFKSAEVAVKLKLVPQVVREGGAIELFQGRMQYYTRSEHQHISVWEFSDRARAHAAWHAPL